jgi:hypothetical protein
MTVVILTLPAGWTVAGFCRPSRVTVNVVFAAMFAAVAKATR